MSGPTKTPFPPTFKLERYFAEYEFNTKHLLCCSDGEAMTMKQLLAQADPECQDLWENLSLQYTDTLGHPLLRQEIVELYDSKITTDDVLVITPQEGIFIAMTCFMKYFEGSNEPVHAVVSFPAYQSLFDNLTTLNCQMSHWLAKPKEDGWKFDIQELEGLVQENTKLLVVNFPHNPTGFIPTFEEWMQIVNLCKSKGIFLFCDEIYWLSNNDGSKPLPSACMVDYDRTMCMSGLSKSYGLPGIRIGWLCTRFRPMMDLMVHLKDYITICSSAPSEILSIIALRSREYCINNILDIVKTNLKILDEFFGKYPDLFKWRKPKACTIGFLEIKGWLLNLGEGGASGFCKVLLKEAGVLLVPGKTFEFEDNYVRVGFARKNMPEAVEALEKFITTTMPK